MVAAERRKVVITPVVVLLSRVAEISLHQRDEELWKFSPPSGGRLIHAEIVGQRLIELGLGHRQIAGKKIVESGNIGRALDGSMAAQRENSSTGPADISQQQLDDGRGADILDANRMLRPSDGIAECSRAISSR